MAKICIKLNCYLLFMLFTEGTRIVMPRYLLRVIEATKKDPGLSTVELL